MDAGLQKTIPAGKSFYPSSQEKTGAALTHWRPVVTIQNARLWMEGASEAERQKSSTFICNILKQLATISS